MLVEGFSQKELERLVQYAEARGQTPTEFVRAALEAVYRSASLGDRVAPATNVTAGGSATVTNNHFTFGDIFSNNFSNNVVRFMIPGLPEGLNATAARALSIAFGLGAVVGGVLVVLWLSSLASG